MDEPQKAILESHPDNGGRPVLEVHLREPGSYATWPGHAPLGSNRPLFRRKTTVRVALNQKLTLRKKRNVSFLFSPTLIFIGYLKTQFSRFFYPNWRQGQQNGPTEQK